MKNTWECEGDCYNGKGTKKWKDGGIEKGTWKNGELIGQGYQFFGKTSDFSGDFYEGEFLNGYHGYGKYYDKSEDATYIGYWQNGKADGKGKLTFGQNSEYPNRYYDGDWKNGKRHGDGVKFWGEAGKYTNNKYDGEWKKDEMDGFGRYDWPDKGTYIGPWKDGEQHGEGIYIFLNGDTLKSRWIEGYCKDLAVLETGKDASYFKTQIDELTIPASEISQRFIDETVRELTLYDKNSSYNVDFQNLRKLLDKALVSQRELLPKLEKIEEYDKKITYKQDRISIEYALLDVLNECDTWINLTLEQSDDDIIQESFDKVFEKLKVMKEKQNEFEKTKNRFKKKYW
jgi:hypothetical protein